MEVQIHDKTFKSFIPEENLLDRIGQLAKEINACYKGEEIVLVAVLNGSFMFASDLIKKLEGKVQISFVKLSSYSGTKSIGQVNELIGLNEDIEGKQVIVLEDIVDTGLTIEKLLILLNQKNPKSIEVCTLLFKPDAFKGRENPRFIGFEIENKFVVGYGLDYNELGRNLNSIYQLK